MVVAFKNKSLCYIIWEHSRDESYMFLLHDSWDKHSSMELTVIWTNSDSQFSWHFQHELSTPEGTSVQKKNFVWWLDFTTYFSKFHQVWKKLSLWYLTLPKIHCENVGMCNVVKQCEMCAKIENVQILTGTCFMVQRFIFWHFKKFWFCQQIFEHCMHQHFYDGSLLNIIVTIFIRVDEILKNMS